MSETSKFNRPQLPLQISHFDHLPSTNAFLMELARCGKKEGLVVIADRQSEGRGRLGRSFYSPEGSGLYMSILLRPFFQSDVAINITTAAAVAVAEAIEALTEHRVSIKWVNDMILRGKKVGGILTEAALTLDGKGLDFAVLGIGVNIATPRNGFPDEIKKVAGSLDVAPSSRFRDRLAEEILTRFFRYYRHLENNSHYEAYRSRLSFLGKNVIVMQGDLSYTALACDIDRSFRLLLQKEDGNFDILSSGEISIKL